MKCLLLVALLWIPIARAELFNGPNNPSNFNRIAGISLITHFDSLPAAGKLIDDRLSWSETYWPSNVGGIAYRWNSPDPQPFKYKMYTKAELQKMSFDEMGQLSPAELYDIANNDYNYTLTRRAFGLYSKHDLWWEGICHGWSQAASHYPEPAPVVVTNDAGIKVPFGSSDVKGLLAMHEAYNYGGTYAFIGQRCRAVGKVPGEGDLRDTITTEPTEEVRNSIECKDVNAGAFHVVISNMIGILGKGFVADIDRYNDVWNQPLNGYSMKVVSEETVTAEDRAIGIERKLRINLNMVYGEELKYYTETLAQAGNLNFVSKWPVTMTPAQKFLSRNYDYVIELDGAGKVIGGQWFTETRPDFMWMYQRAKSFKNSPMPLANLKNIYRPLKR
jgi:hypothetical protein